MTASQCHPARPARRPVDFPYPDDMIEGRPPPPRRRRRRLRRLLRPALYAVDLATGKENWRYLPAPGGASSRPVQGRPRRCRRMVYVGDGSDDIFLPLPRRPPPASACGTFETVGAEIAGGANFRTAPASSSAPTTKTCTVRLQRQEVLEGQDERPVNGSLVVGRAQDLRRRLRTAPSHIIDLKKGKERAPSRAGPARPPPPKGKAAVCGDFLYVAP